MEHTLHKNLDKLILFKNEMEKLFEKELTELEIGNIMQECYDISNALFEELLNCDLIKLNMIYKCVIDKFQKKKSIDDIKRYYHIFRLNCIISYIFNIKEDIEIISKENKLRNELQEKYVSEITSELEKHKRVFMKAPTGFGKTHVNYKLIKKNKFMRILFLTPRILLNEQIVDDKYTSYIKDDNYKIIHLTGVSSRHKNKLIKKYSNNNKNIIMTSCYQSGKNLIKILKKYKFCFDLIVFDEAHFITSWGENDNDFLSNNKICKYRLFQSATPTEDIELKPLIYGKVIEKVKIYELILAELLCNIETIVKQLNVKKTEYHNLKDLIVQSMIKYKKKKGIIYVNTCKNAENLYKLMQEQDKLNVYIYISGNIEVENDSDTDIESFENDDKQCIIICVGKIGYGYDNPYIDFICLGDPRQSDTDIRQIIGRGLRWNKSLYPNKLLHLLIPLYKDQFDNYSKNEHLKKYLDYIIGECGKDIIIKKNGTSKLGNKKENCKTNGEDYDGDNIPIEILNEYCTTGYNKFTDFKKFLRSNNIINEISYNELKSTMKWMPQLGLIHKKYPKFCFRDIHPDSIDYYWDLEDAIININIAKKILRKNIGKDIFSDLTYGKIIKEINTINKKIPLIDIDLYYPKK